MEDRRERLKTSAVSRYVPPMLDAKLRAWWWHRQGLDGSLAGKTPAEVLERAGWARSTPEREERGEQPRRQGSGINQ